MNREAVVDCVAEAQRVYREEVFLSDPGRPDDEIEPEPIRCPHCMRLTSNHSILIKDVEVLVCPFCHRVIE